MHDGFFLIADGVDLHRVSIKNVPLYFLKNYSMKHWPILIIFGTPHHEET